MRLRLLWLCSSSALACSEERAALDGFLNLGSRDAPSDARGQVDPGSLEGVRARRFDFGDPDRVRIDAELEVPISTPPGATLPLAEAAARALLTDGQAVAARVLVVPEGLPAELGAIALAVQARDGKGWSGTEVAWRRTQVLATAGPPPSDAEAQLAGAVARSHGPMERRFEAVAGVSAVSVAEVRQACDKVGAYLGDP